MLSDTFLGMKQQLPSDVESRTVPAHTSGAAASGMVVPPGPPDSDAGRPETAAAQTYLPGTVEPAAAVPDAVSADPMAAWAALGAAARAVADAPLWRCSDE